MTIHRHVCGFESGDEQQWTNGAAATGAANATVGAALTGDYGLHLNPAGAGAFCGRQMTACPRAYVGRFKIHFPSLPTGATKQLVLFCSSLASDFPSVFLEYDPSDGTLRMVSYAGGGVVQATSVGPVVSAGESYTISWRNRGSSMDTLFDWSVDGVAQDQIVGTGGINIWYFGRNTSQTYSAYYDDIAFVWTNDAGDQDEVSALHPLPHAASVKGLAPVANGTNVGASSFTPSTGTLADSWQFLDNIPISGTTAYVAQTTQGAGDYVEYEFEGIDDNEEPVGGASLTYGMRSDGLSGNNGKLHLVNGGTDETVFDGLWLSGGITVQSAGNDNEVLTRAEANALLVRWGYSSDIISVPRLGALLLEVDVEPVTETHAGSHQVEGENQLDRALWIPRPHPFLGRMNQHAAQL